MVKSVLDADPAAWAFNAGDLVFNGTAVQYSDGYDPSWGAFRDRTLFALGNHDRMSDPTARPYYEYTGAERYYARTLGSWRVYVLNTEAADKGGASSWEQTAWLRADIARYSNYHIMAMWHYPMYSNICAVHRKAMVWPGKVGAWWQVLQDHGAEFVVSGHVHRWERFRRLIRSGVRGGIASSRGIRQFVAGTGGGNLYGVLSKDPNCQRTIVARGVAQFNLYPDRYAWRFTDTAGVVRDSGTQLCRKVLAA